MSNILSISSKDYRAEIRLKGGGLNSLTNKRRNLVEPFKLNEPNRFRGDVLLPWPNRIRDGQYTYLGTKYSLPMNESGRSNALHGLVLEEDWIIRSQSNNQIVLGCTLDKPQSYPSVLEITVTYTLTDKGLKWEIKTINCGKEVAPYGHSIHPYLIAENDSKADNWFLKLPANKYMEVDAVRLLPTEIKNVRENFQFSSGRRINDTFIDHAFLIDGSMTNQVIELTNSSGYGVGMRYSSDLKWIQIHTADRDNPLESRKCLAVEPMTCPPDAFNSGIDIVHLKPGEEISSFWEIFAI